MDCYDLPWNGHDLSQIVSSVDFSKTGWRKKAVIQDEGLLHKEFPLFLFRLSIPFLLIDLAFTDGFELLKDGNYLTFALRITRETKSPYYSQLI